MENNKLQPLSEMEKRQAEEHHGLVYSFLHRHGYSIEEFYNICIFGYLKGIQTYNRREDLKEKYQLAFICEQYMRAEIKDQHRRESQRKQLLVWTLTTRKQTTSIILLVENLLKMNCWNLNC